MGDLQESLELAFTTPATILSFPNPYPNPGFVITEHSTSLVAKSKLTINPHAIIFTYEINAAILADIVIMGYNRGEQLVEIPTIDRNNS